MLRRMWNSWNIQAKLLLSILLVLGATVITSGVLFYLSSAAAIERQTLSLTDNTVEQMNKNIDLYVSEIERLSLAMFGDATVQRVLRASDPGARDRRHQQDVDDITYRMLTLAASWQSVHGMYIFSNDGALFYTTRGALPGPATAWPTSRGTRACASKPRRRCSSGPPAPKPPWMRAAPRCFRTCG